MGTTLLQVRSPAPATAGRSVFVSYSHKDRRCLEEFRAQVAPLVGAAGLDMFFDQDRLKPGDEWNEAIHGAVKRCDIFLLFVSPNSLNSAYCMNRELLVALDRHARGLCVIVPIILVACPWTMQLLPDGSQRTLEHFNALPVGYRPVMSRDAPAARAQVWEKVVNDIGALVGRGGVPAAQPATTLPHKPARIVPPMLPYLCDEQQPDWAVLQILQQWQAQAVPVLLLVRGAIPDCPDKFTERIVERRLVRVLQRIAPKLGVQAHHGLQWPDPAMRDAASLDAYFLAQLAERVMDDAFASGDQLAAHITDTNAHHLVLVGLPHALPEHLQRTTRALAACLGRLAPRVAPRRLAAVLWSEDDALKALALDTAWTAEGTRALIGLPLPLETFGLYEIGQWAVLEEVQRVSRLKAPDINKAFAGRPTEITMNDFVETIMPVLQHGT